MNCKRYAAGRTSSTRKGRTSKFGWLQGPATKNMFLSVTSGNPATIRIDDFTRQCQAWPRPSFSMKPPSGARCGRSQPK